jgi:YegS/Rv2252/BmrU family lipid kinase
MKPVVIYSNPASGRYNAQLTAKMQAQVLAKFGYCQLVQEVAELEKVKDSHIVLCGGDGTVHTAATHANLESNSFSVVAMGSGNDFIKNFPKTNFTQLLNKIEEGRIDKVDLLEVNGKRAAVLVGVGFDAFISHIAKRSNIKIPALKYIIPVARHMFFYKGIQMQIKGDGIDVNKKIFMLSCGNGFRAGGGFKLFPKAKINDGKMDVLMIEPPTFWQKLKYVWLVNFGKHLNLDIVKYIQTDSITVELEDEDYYNTDGDVYRAKSFEIKVIPSALNMIM